MIISHRHKFIYLRPAKTGSSSAQVMIADSGILGSNDVCSPLDEMNYKTHYRCNGHATLNELFSLGLIDLNMESDYLILMTIRDPVERFISCYFFKEFLLNKNPTLSGLKRYIESDSELSTVLGRPQSQYAISIKSKAIPKNIKIIDISDIDILIPKFVRSFGGDVTVFTRAKSNCRPAWGIHKYTNYLHRKYVNLLNKKLSSEIDFYNQLKRVNSYV